MLRGPAERTPSPGSTSSTRSPGGGPAGPGVTSTATPSLGPVHSGAVAPRGARPTAARVASAPASGPSSPSVSSSCQPVQTPVAASRVLTLTVPPASARAGPSQPTPSRSNRWAVRPAGSRPPVSGSEVTEPPPAGPGSPDRATGAPPPARASAGIDGSVRTAARTASRATGERPRRAREEMRITRMFTGFRPGRHATPRPFRHPSRRSTRRP